MKALQITAWATTFETAESRKKIRAMQWFACPSGCESNGFLTLAGLGAEGAQALGIFMALCQGYSGKFKVENRDGCFKKTAGKAMSLGEIAALIRMDKALVIKAVELLSSEDVGWLEWVDLTSSDPHPDAIRMPSGVHPDYSTGEESTGEDKTVHDTGNSPRGDSGDLLSGMMPVKADHFDMFWEIMPTKKGKGAAMKAFREASKKHPPDFIIRRTAFYIADEQAKYRRDPAKYSPLHPATWLNQGRFDDEPDGIPVPPKKILHAAWTACGRNGSGPPDWPVLAQDKALVQEMRNAYPAFDLLVEGIMECVQIVTKA